MPERRRRCDRQKTPIPDRFDGNPVRVALRIANEIGKAPLERIGPHGDQRIARKRDFGIKPGPLGVEAQILQKLLHVDIRRALPGIAPREGEIGLEHALHFLDVFLQVPRLFGLPHQGKRKLEPCQDGAQIVAHPIQHRGALLEARSIRCFISMKA
jgi:hypothetical protein